MRGGRAAELKAQELVISLMDQDVKIGVLQIDGSSPRWYWQGAKNDMQGLHPGIAAVW